MLLRLGEYKIRENNKWKPPTRYGVIADMLYYFTQEIGCTAYGTLDNRRWVESRFQMNDTLVKLIASYFARKMMDGGIPLWDDATLYVTLWYGVDYTYRDIAKYYQFFNWKKYADKIYNFLHIDNGTKLKKEIRVKPWWENESDVHQWKIRLIKTYHSVIDNLEKVRR